MKTLILAFFSILLFTNVSHAADAQRIAFAAKILAGIAQGSHTHQVSPGDVKSMLLEFGLKEQMVESEKDFESSWKANSSAAWEADSMNWGTDTAQGALSYIKTALEQDLEGSEHQDTDKIKFADGTVAAKRAFGILKSIKSVKYGVAPTGAVQCGVTFSSLFISDTATGTMYQIIMEGSGC